MKKRLSILKKLTAALLAATMIIMMPGVESKAVTSSGAIAKGIDVSKYQGTVNWSQVAASGVKFAFIKIGSTYSGLDPMFAYNMQQAQANGIKTGVYIYSYATNVEQATAEAALVIQWLSAYQVQMPVVFDIEDSVHKGLSAADVNAIINTFCILVDAAGYYPMVYSYKTFFNSKIGATPWDKWVAQFADSCDYGGSVAIWQNSSKATISGISGYVDTDYLYKDYSNLIIKEGFVAHNGSTRFYQDWKMKTGWVSYQGGRYLFDQYGYIVKGWYVDSDAKMYYLSTDDGKAAVGPTKIDGSTFYFDANGAAQYGFVDYGQGMKYFDPTLNGAMATSWFAYNGQMFCAGSDGTVLTGYQTINKVPYYFEENGALAINKQVKVGKKTYMAGADGVLTEVAATTDAQAGIKLSAEEMAEMNGIDLSTLNEDQLAAFQQAVDAYNALIP